MYAAYDTLPGLARNRRSAVQARSASRNSAASRKGQIEVADPRDAGRGASDHPHSSGNAPQCTVLAAVATFVGLQLEVKTCSMLWAHATQRRFAWYQQ
jgi:hypothetical protein